ncbi:MAG: S-methyl-5-thioribose-1-phosphate isomerase [Eubacteriales bacterium]|nr:S-methyl-5-thioribose-1-phosphate isomerase [Eubacteriales bacterium]
MVEVTAVKFEDDKLVILDQTKLPGREEYVTLETKEGVWDAIKKLMVRGAPAIGIAAAYGLYVTMRDSETADIHEFVSRAQEAADYLNSSRPTAVNLSWALKRQMKALRELESQEKSVDEAKQTLLEVADQIRQEDEDSCKAMGEYGLSLLKPGMGILTHCNAGTLATAKYGTSIAPLYLGQERGYNFRVFSDETRPLLQGARLTAWEMVKAGIDETVICDNMAYTVMKKGWIDAVMVGCDRMAANGDGANKIGTAGLSVIAKSFGIPFYMFVPTSTIDFDTPTGDDITIELRDGEEIRSLWYAEPQAPEGAKFFNPAFDVTPAENITAIITENGIVRPPFSENLRKAAENRLED